MKYLIGFYFIFLFASSIVQAQILTQWTPYSECPVTCNFNNPVRTRTRTCTPANLCQGVSLFETFPCNREYSCPEYRLGDWGTWSACSESCKATQNYPTRVRTRSYCLSNSTSSYQCTPDYMISYEPCNIAACSSVKSCSSLNFTFVFVLDSSSTIDTQEWIDEKNLVLTFVRSSAFGVNSNVDVAVVNFASSAQIEADCGTYKSYSAFETFMNNLKVITGGTAIHRGLVAGETAFQRCQKLNNNPVIILLTDGYENIDENIHSNIVIENRIKNQALLVAGAVKEYKKDEIDRITSYIVDGQNISYSYYASNFTALYNTIGNTLYSRVVARTGCETQGFWTTWSAWSSCSQLCGFTGTIQRSRSCINPTTNKPQEDCEVVNNIANLDFMTCFQPCTASFSEWSSWSACSASCRLGSGPPTTTRFRTCSSGLGSCIGSLSETLECNTNTPCQGTLSLWGLWGQCSASCQLTSVLPTQQRSRVCVGATLGGNCDGQSTVDSQSCNVGIYCPGTISDWSSWGACSDVCNNLVTPPSQTRSRSCIGYSTWDPTYLGCPSISRTEQQPCNINIGCSGTYGDWSAWSSCSESCQSNINVSPFQTQTRQCFGATIGGGCSGPSSQTQNCNVQVPCPGSLSDWAAWGACSASCQLGLIVPQQTSTRTCSGASFGGNCNGAVLTQTKNCNAEVLCPGVLTDWTAWGICSATCNTQVNGPFQTRDRSCVGFSTWNPNFAGCVGATRNEQQLCNQNVPCPGNYGAWAAWGSCSESCQSNVNIAPFQTQTRSCLGATLNGGCPGASSQTQSCNVGVSCPGILSLWGAWGACTASCQVSFTSPTQTRTRQCNGATFNGNCNGLMLTDTQNCNEQVYCPGTISDWSSWSVCSASCNNLVTVPSQTRTRSCSGFSTWDPTYTGCPGITRSEQISCNANVGCPGTYSVWNAWSTCSESCQSNANLAPFQTQTRQCIGATLGAGCAGPSSQTQNCNVGVSCPGILSDWAAWGACSASCQLEFVVPQQTSTRTCSGASFGGNCNGAVLTQSKNCNAEVLCPGVLTDWAAWSTCSASCNTLVNGGPIQTRTRTCNGFSTWNPNFMGCVGASRNEQQLCNQLVSCPGFYTAWSAWSTCSESCQSNVNSSPSQFHTRNCVNFTLNGGCVGLSSETQNCNFQVSCPGDLTQWSTWSSCSQSCQISSVVPTMSRNRNCLNPTFGGNCQGQSLSDVMSCNAGVVCPGQLTDWTSWSQCPATCQQAVGQFNMQYRSRQCVNTTTGNCGEALLNDQVVCVRDVPCPGILGQWSTWSTCSESCRSNLLIAPSQTRTRTCTTATLGANCGGASLVESLTCNANVGCPGVWTSWGPFTDCSASCQSTGNIIPTQSRQRFCVNNTLDGPCPSDNNGDKIQTVQCNVGVICPVRGTWGAWGDWSSCSASCDAGVIQRSRACSVPYPIGAGDDCIGNTTQTLPCKLFDCPKSCAIAKRCNCSQVKQWSSVPTFDQFQSRGLTLGGIETVLGYLSSYRDDTVDKACQACNTMVLTTLRSNVADQLTQAKATRAKLELIKNDLRDVIYCNGVILNNPGLWNLYDLLFERATMLDGVIIELNAIYLRFDAALTSCQSYGWIHQTFKTILRKCTF